MIKSLFRFIFLMLFCTSGQVHAQKIMKKVNDHQGNPKIVIFKKTSSYQMQNPKQVFQEQLKISEDYSFQKTRSESDQLGYIHDKYQQYYKHLKVEFATYALHGKNHKVTSISGAFYDIQNLKVTPKISQKKAFQEALRHINARRYLWEDLEAAKAMDNYQKPVGELLILPLADPQTETLSYKLAYKFDIYATNPISRGHLYIDANTGEAIFYNPIIKHTAKFGHVGEVKHDKNTKLTKPIKATLEAMISGTATTRYSGTQTIETTQNGGLYTLNDASRQVYTRDAQNRNSSYINNYAEFTDNNNNWTAAEHDNAAKDNAALDAHWGAMMTYDYWEQVHNRNSYDNAGAQIRSYVHVRSNYDNAFWNGSVMSYGDGSSNGAEGNGLFDALTSIDVAAHEIGHAVCTFTANLVYRREPGALNEGFSDIWGAAVEHFAKGNGSDTAPSDEVWLIGDEIDRRPGSAALRSMDDPKSLGQPDTYGGANWINPNCGTPSQANDYCGVHTNSGVLNYWFYLLTVGGSGTNDIGSSYSVSGIGMRAAANIAYRLENIYLSSNSDFADARSFGIQSAIDIYGAGSDAEIAVTNAWHAVGVGAAYDEGDGGGDGGGGDEPEVILHEGYFETGLDGWIDGGSDCFRYSGPRSYEGNYSIRLRDNSGIASSMTLGSFDVSAYDQIEIQFFFYAYSMENGEDFWVRYYDGASWNTVAAYARGTNFNNNTFYTATVTIRNTEYNFPNNAQFRFQCDATANGDQVYIDQVTISASSGAAVATNEIHEIQGLFNFAGTEAIEVDNDTDQAYLLYPNPIKDVLHIKTSDPKLTATYEIMNMNGKLVKSGTIQDRPIHVSDLKSGVYLIKINNGEETMVKKIIKK